MNDRQKTQTAQAKAFRQIALLVLTGLADRDPKQFVAEVKVIMQQAAEEGA